MGIYGPGFGFGGFGMFQVMFTIIFLLCTGTFFEEIRFSDRNEMLRYAVEKNNSGFAIQ